MSFTLESSTWKNLKSGHIVSLGVGALAFFAIVGFSGALKSNTPARVSLEEAAVSTSASRSIAPLVVYLVASPEQAAQLQQDKALEDTQMTEMGLRAADPAAILVKTPSVEQALASSADAVAVYGRSVNVIDLTQ